MKRSFFAISLVFSFLAPVSAQAGDNQVTVLSRNLYLGADVGIALELIPDFPAAAQFMWNQVKANDFARRAPKLAQEAISSDADVIGIQEATIWYCKKNAWSKKVEVLNFTKQFLEATKAQGSEYVLAKFEGREAFNPGYSIAAVPFLTMVNDPSTFQPLFGQDKAACGFVIGDALAIKKELENKVLKVGNTEYVNTYSIVPTLMTIYRGYTWADITIGNQPVRFVTTHLESIWDEGKVPNAAKQATQLVKDLQSTTMPVVVIGDFNSDPRDPRPLDAPNPGEQPSASDACPAQKHNCSAYWIMRDAGFIEADPNPLLPENYSWGTSALLAGPDAARFEEAAKMGNEYGFSDRLDYVFIKNGIKELSSTIIGNTWPENENVWQCSNEEQINNTQEIAQRMGIAAPDSGICLATDHAGVLSTLVLDGSKSARSADLPEHKPFPISFWQWVGIALLTLLALLIFRKNSKLLSKSKRIPRIKPI
jgi:hypothetical protein